MELCCRESLNNGGDSYQRSCDKLASRGKIHLFNYKLTQRKLCDKARLKESMKTTKSNHGML